MKKITPFMFIFFVGFVISIASLTFNKKNPSKKNPNIVCENFKTTELSTKDIVDPKILDKSSLLRKAFKRVAGFNGRTYKRPITYYIHDKTGQKNFRLLPSTTNYTYEISDDAERFIVDIFSKLDNYIDLDFERVNSPRRAIIDIYKTKPPEDFSGYASMQWQDRPYKYRVEIAWKESEGKKLESYPTLSYVTAGTLIHEIGHALGLMHGEEYDTIDPYDKRFTRRDTMMSYNLPYCYLPEVDDFFSDVDINALRTVWGEEKGN